uniref:Coatomer subunit beta n=1 Tax=Attheya septentrionalis TaxID=420275 RepID=A0A7S2UK79_9STRA|mmetsp:Transcript_28628/g.52310  ORF Transcript_28628/g.52310 Transcript_28628/m.52310 type:complete len:977 (+) Transcript_28628:72-3002(+)|eukprot:CAMPEP_0198303212 /NCGR_PEP_ID=MMETSP1449-20131203/56770_1 /TAXON_ID=420275 /ORGANISM="Attheya septentrionalis, Strain CCMP2084" /LENGTH=976 /DNA_ID=CAMNT_0044005699 /DNA_START=592 /DNA_END=3525 /DNA_ORIENTATION=-
MPPAKNSNESYCTFTLASDVTAGGLPSEEEIAKDLENTDPKVKRHALKAAIMAMLGGEAMPRILMQVIRFCINSDDKPLKKLCMLYWEVVPKYQEPASDELLRAASGGPAVQRKMLPEMILVCNALMNDLNHPNEFVRGSMLRFLCKVKDEEILGPLMPSVKSCMEHRHPYVRKNAALALFHAHHLHGETLIPDAPELVETFLQNETDTGARRNAFLMLFNEAEDLAINFLANNMDDVGKYGDGFALLVLELTRKVCRRDPTQKSRFVRVLFQMLSSNSAAVSYEAAWTLVSLSSAPTAVRAAALTYTNLLNSQNDNNVKMIVLERLDDLKKKHTKILQELLMDILRALSSPNPDICKKVLDVSMDIVTSRNVADVVSLLKREVTKTEQDSDNTNESKGAVYRNMLIRAIHGCAVRFPDVAESVVHTLMDFLSSDGGMQVIVFVRAIVEQYPDLRPALLTKLLGTLEDVSSNSVMCICLWILGEYCVTSDKLQEAFVDITAQLGDPPFLLKSNEKDAQEKAVADAAAGPKLVTKNVILSDGTYATQTVYSEAKANPAAHDSTPHLRKMIIGGDVFLGSIVSSCLTKLCLRAADLGEIDPVTLKNMTTKTLLLMCGIVKMSEVTVSAQKSSLADCNDRVTLCCRALLDPKANALLKGALLSEGKATFAAFLKTLKDKELNESKKNEEKLPVTQADDLIHFRQLRSMTVQGGDLDLDDGSDLARATGYSDSGSALSSELNHVYQLSGFSDPVYAEALVTVHDYDIVLEILLINRTPNTLSNLTVELSTMGDMKIVERPQSHTIGPLDQITIRASIKVSSTETGHIFGTIVYVDEATQEKGYVNLNDIHMDIMDYIRPATCTDEMFRSMWAEFEWENKVAISTSIPSLVEFLNHIVSSTNMRCLTPHDSTEKGSFLAANLYARSVFEEDALVNVSVEKKEDNDGKLAGYIRIRSKTQGIALSLGDRITSVQRGLPDNKA